jgi:hypothetical protein
MGSGVAVVDLPILRLRPPGPVAAAFMADRTNQVRALLGPQGGGKTVACISDGLTNAGLMPVCRDDAIHFRIAIVRDTYGRLDETTIPSWQQWIPKDSGDWTGGGGRQAHHKLQFATIRPFTTRSGGRGTRKININFEAIFAAIGDQSVEDFMRGFEVTAFWFNEMDRLSRDCLTYGIGRIGRYPNKAMLQPGDTYRDYIVGDLNAPDIDSWFYTDFEETQTPGFKLYTQPSGRSPQAENIHNLKPGYYDDQVRLNASKPRWITRFVDAKYGPSEDGEPVYPEYADALHLAPAPLNVIPGLPLRIGLDAGLQRPAAVFGQWLPSGQWRILGELVPGRMGASRFAPMVQQWLNDHAPGVEAHIAFADPAGFTGADREAGELAWAETMASVLGIPIEPAPSNELGLRLDAVRDELTFMIDGTTPALLLSPACKVLRKGFASHYRFQTSIVGQARRTSNLPEKNDFSHPHDALQYMLLGAKGRYGVIADGQSSANVRMKPAREKERQTSHTMKSSFNPLGRR